MTAPRGCDHPGCPARHYSHGYCRHHAWQAERYGQPTDPPGRLWSPPGRWVALAACGDDPERQFAEDYRAMAEAKRVCSACPVQPECLAYALEHAEPFGVWGGMSSEERAAALAGKRAVA